MPTRKRPKPLAIASSPKRRGRTARAQLPQPARRSGDAEPQHRGRSPPTLHSPSPPDPPPSSKTPSTSSPLPSPVPSKRPRLKANIEADQRTTLNRRRKFGLSSSLRLLILQDRIAAAASGRTEKQKSARKRRPKLSGGGANKTCERSELRNCSRSEPVVRSYAQCSGGGRWVKENQNE
jgi:hypothetical protein